jgi:hypothetical protein
MAGSVNQNSRFDLGVRKVFFIPAPKIVLQQYRPYPEVFEIGADFRLWPLGAVPLDGVSTAAIEGVWYLDGLGALYGLSARRLASWRLRPCPRRCQEQ